jgi:hypothetical protein
MNIPSIKEFRKGCEEFEKREKRDAMYEVATFLIKHFRGNPSKMADGLGVLLFTWNQAFYRYGSFDFDKLVKCIDKNFQKIKFFRNRDISSLSYSDHGDIKVLFNEFLEALRIDTGNKKRDKKSPVSVAKALHLLAPKFFPLWDVKIAKAYRCYYSKNPLDKYISFCEEIKIEAAQLRNQISHTDKTIIKLIDEYNYAKYTKGWI